MSSATGTDPLPVAHHAVTPYRHEQPLFLILAVLSVLFWLALTAGTFGIIWIYILFFYIFFLFAHSLLISMLKGNAVQITHEQFPDLHARLERCCNRLGISETPKAYVMSGNGLLNAFATRFLGRYYVVLLSDIIDALEDDPEAINFYIGHELGHVHRKHIAHGWWLGPTMLLPLLGAAYRRSQEYTCDQYGLACCNSKDSAARAIAVLAAGTRRWKQLNTASFISQCKQTGGFWMSLHELAGDYPWLCKRMAQVYTPEYRPPSRHLAAWFFALFMPRVGGRAGALGSIVIMVAIIGILAAIALPQYQAYTLRASSQGAFAFGESLARATGRHFADSRRLPAELSSLGITQPESVASATLDQRNGEISIALKNGQSIKYVPSLNQAGQIEWACTTSMPTNALEPGRQCTSSNPYGGGNMRDIGKALRK